jgi:hypothetical protein
MEFNGIIVTRTAIAVYKSHWLSVAIILAGSHLRISVMDDYRFLNIFIPILTRNKSESYFGFRVSRAWSMSPYFFLKVPVKVRNLQETKWVLFLKTPCT